MARSPARLQLVPRDPAKRALLEGLSTKERADELWSLFLADKAHLTRENYERDLRSFAEFLGADSVSDALCQLLENSAGYAHKLVVAYHAHLVNARVGEGEQRKIGYAPATIRRRIYALRSVVELANMIGVVNWRIRIKLGSVEPQRGTRGPGPDGYASVLSALDGGISTAREAGDDRALQIALRDRVLIRLLHDSGLRRFETIGIEWPRGVRLEREPSVLVLGKGKRRHQWVPISTICADQIREYLVVRGRRAGYLISGTGSRASARMNRSTVNRRVSHWAHVAGVPFTPHGLRHTATTTALDAEKGDKRVVKRWSRHQVESSLDPYDDRRRQDDRRLAEILSDPSEAEPHS